MHQILSLRPSPEGGHREAAFSAMNKQWTDEIILMYTTDAIAF
jgi:hypothetical protein